MAITCTTGIDGKKYYFKDGKRIAAADVKKKSGKKCKVSTRKPKAAKKSPSKKASPKHKSPKKKSPKKSPQWDYVTKDGKRVYTLLKK